MIYTLVNKRNNMKTRFLIFAALGAAAVLLLTTDKGKKLTKNVADTTGDWTNQLRDLLNASASELNKLKSIVGHEVEGLSDDARERILNILNESKASAGRVKKSAAKQLS